MAVPDLLPPPTFDQPRQRAVAVHLHARFVAAEQLEGGVVIVIDALRASVTFAQALAAGSGGDRAVLVRRGVSRRAAALPRQPHQPSLASGPCTKPGHLRNPHQARDDASRSKIAQPIPR